MAQQTDFMVFGPEGQPVLGVEAKALYNKDATWAAKYRRNLAAHGVLWPVPYFLLAFPDRFYLWTDGITSPDEVPPSHEIDTRELLRPHFDRAHLSPDKVGQWAFELLLSSWLESLIRRDTLPAEPAESWSWLAESGLFEALKGGAVEYPVTP